MRLRLTKISPLRATLLALAWLGNVFAQTSPAQKQATSVDLLITGGTVITMDSERRVIENGEVAVRGDSIVAVGPTPLFAEPNPGLRKPLKIF